GLARRRGDAGSASRTRRTGRAARTTDPRRDRKGCALAHPGDRARMARSARAIVAQRRACGVLPSLPAPELDLAGAELGISHGGSRGGGSFSRPALLCHAHGADNRSMLPRSTMFGSMLGSTHRARPTALGVRLARAQRLAAFV